MIYAYSLFKITRHAHTQLQWLISNGLDSPLQVTKCSEFAILPILILALLY